MGKRCKNLDIYRGLIMIYIIGIIHNLYWTPIISSSIKSLLLVEMPIIFFITGASNSLKETKIIDFYKKRLKRIITPYFIYAVICFTFITLLNYYLTYTNGYNYLKVNTIKILLSWINPFGKWIVFDKIRYLSAHLWFIPIYLLIMIFFPLLKFMYNNLVGIYKTMPLILIIFIVIILDKYDNICFYSYVKEIIVYSFFVYLGLYYNRNVKIPKYRVFLISLMAFMLVFLFRNFCGYKTYDMQFNKFPPNIIFLFYNIGWLGLLYILKEYIVKIYNFKYIKNVVDQYSKYGYTMYLYQGFSFIILDIINKFLKIYNFKIGLVFNFFVLIFMGLVFSRIFGKFEDSICNVKI